MASKTKGADTPRKRGAAPKFSKTQVAKIREAYGTGQGRGKRSTGGTTIAELATRHVASVATIRAIVNRTGAYVNF